MSTSSPTLPRYLVGIDLGTTHTVVAFADTATGGNTRIELFEIEQLIAPGQVDARPLLPSIRYHPAPEELSEADTRLPWSKAREPRAPIFGELARQLGSKSHGRLVTSAKSWLSHGAVDRTAAILPWGAAEDVAKVSPVDASASYLAYVRDAWNHRFPEHRLEDQEVVVTLPASFDESARALTLEAARSAGLNAVRLVEEPQAACYDWLWRHRKSLARSLADVRLLLVVDVGGGTTDLTLIRVEPGDSGDSPALKRIGVGNHLMLGGDNIDLTLAHLAESRLLASDQRLSAAQLAQLVDQCRSAKERLLSDESAQSASVTLLGSGSRLIGGARTTEFAAEEVRRTVLDGFFPLVASDAQPDRKRSGVVEFGLPYAADPAISRHLAAFLLQHGQSLHEGTHKGEPARPDAILLNGGAFRSPLIAGRVIELLSNWTGRTPKHLRNEHPDLAVAYGAVAYGLARHGLAVRRIGGGSARSYFLLVETETGREMQQGVCLLPHGTEEGTEILLSERSFALRLGQPVRFHLVSSTQDRGFRTGELVTINEQDFVHLPPLAVAFGHEGRDSRREIQVQLAAALTDLGTLAIQCVATDDPTQRWDVEFQLRKRPDTELVTRHPRCGDAVALIQRVYGKKAKDVDPKAVKALRNELEKLLGKREDWETPLLRELFAALLEGLPHRRRSPEHERTWLSLTGYCLRPGFGAPLDDWRVERIWALYEQGIQHVNEAQNWAEWWTLWRRVGGGLSAQAQSRIFADLADFINPDTARRGNLPTLAKKRAYEDMLRLAAVLERIPAATKIELGGWLLQRLSKASESAETWWALGRVGARLPFHGSAHEVVPRAVAERWLSALLEFDWKKNALAGFAATLIARICGDRDREISQELRARVLDRLHSVKAPETWLGMVAEFKQLDAADERRTFGEALPPGLKLLA